MRRIAHRGWPQRRLLDVASLLTTPLAPDDFLGLVNPLWSNRQLAGRVVDVRQETSDSATIVIRPGAGWRGHRAGQHVTLGIAVDGVRHQRSYSLTSPPRGVDGHISIAVKAVRDGLVSTHLVRRTAPGSIVFLGQAAGGFVLPEPPPERLLFVTAGSGVTPVMGMLRTLARSGALHDAVLVHVDRQPSSVMFAGELRRHAGRRTLRLHEHHTAQDGRPSAAEILQRVPDWTERETWACGPSALLDDLQTRFDEAGVAARLRVERFHPAVAPGAHDAEGGTVTFTRSGVTVDVDGTTTLLAAGEAAGALLPSGCRAGICRTCVGSLRAGLVRDVRTGQVSGGAGDVIQTCVSVAAGAVAIDL
ncbi:NADPH oxidoreductase [Baekduia alba]|uniref:ferredoxin reductase n=1 Tax=Baekduia alba TaxID=2997333 RepID=UPI002340B800|nr:ferredoxin reductase [Baekduia alba]WCB95937.1 NADPH oxidoreductase [Baekduia alba]